MQFFDRTTPVRDPLTPMSFCSLEYPSTHEDPHPFRDYSAEEVSFPVERSHSHGDVET